MGRYISEDLPSGLVPISQLGQVVGIPPTIDALFDIGSVVCDEDFRATGRGIDELGFKGLGPKDITGLVRAPVLMGGES
jgi:opine dehydrogenase